MAETSGVRAAGLLIDQARAADRKGHYQQALSAAERAVQAARQLDDAVLLVRALSVEAKALRLTGDYAAALAPYTQILGMAEDAAYSGRLDHPEAAEAVAGAYWNWVGSARYLMGIPLRELLRVLDAGDQWLAATGHLGWRASVLAERAMVHDMLGESAAAVAAAEEALITRLRQREAPGYSLEFIRCTLGDILLRTGRPAEAMQHYQAVIVEAADPRDRAAAQRGQSWGSERGRAQLSRLGCSRRDWSRVEGKRVAMRLWPL